jgi:hypothetical protein
MIFRQWKQILDGEKTKIRRPVREGDRLHSIGNFENGKPIAPDYYVGNDSRIRWKTWRVYAVQPGRGKKAVGRIRITGIRREWLDDISPEDCLAEGIQEIPNQWGTPWYRCPGLEGGWKSSRAAFRALWDSIYEGTEFEFAANPEVWVLMFEVVR